MDRTYAAGDATDVLGQNAFLDFTDKENDEVRCAESRNVDKPSADSPLIAAQFIYIY